MDQTQPYEAFLEHYEKQERLLIEKDQDCEMLHSKYVDSLSRRDNIIPLNKNTHIECMNKKIKVVESVRVIRGLNNASDLGVKEVKQQLNKLSKSMTQNNSLQEKKVNSFQQTSKGLKQLIDNQKQLENISKKTQEYKRKLQEVNEIVHKRNGDIQNFSSYISGYRPTPQEKQFKRKDFKYTLTEVNEYIKQGKNNIHTIDFQVAEIRKQI